MYGSISKQALDAFRTSHKAPATAVHTNVITGSPLGLDIVDGTVTEDATTPQRRSLSLSLPPSAVTWDALDTVGGEIAITKDVRYASGDVESIPMGVFIVDQDQIDYGPDGSIQMTCPDRWVKLRTYLSPADANAVRSNTGLQEIKRLVEGAWGGSYPFPGWSAATIALFAADTTPKVGDLVYTDRASGVQQLATLNSLDVFFDRVGLGVIRRTPLLTNTSQPVATIDAGKGGILVSAGRTRDRSTVRNQITVTTNASDIYFSPVYVKNTTVGDPLSVNGPLRTQNEDYSDSFRNSTQARAAGLLRLSKSLAVAKQLTLESAPNYALDAQDIVLVILPQTQTDGTTHPTELHIIDSIRTPLSVSSPAQSLTTRSTRPATDGT